jgi:hypothetical protein
VLVQDMIGVLGDLLHFLDLKHRRPSVLELQPLCGPLAVTQKLLAYNIIRVSNIKK